MQQSDRRRRTANVPAFVNHTPRSWGITASSVPSQSPAAVSGVEVGTVCHPEMSGGPTSRTIGLAAGPPYINPTVMGQVPSSFSSSSSPSSSSTTTSSAEQQREKIRKASSTTILREDSIRQVEEIAAQPYVANEAELLPPLSTEDSWSMHYDCTDQAPYLDSHSVGNGERMMTQTSLLGLPRSNELHDLAFFLKTTGPTAPHRKPIKVENRPPRLVSAPKNALRFLRFGGSRKHATPRERLSATVFKDEGGLLSSIPVEQKMSSAGKRYLALVPETIPAEHRVEKRSDPSILCPDILESRVSICFHHEARSSSEVLDSWLSALNKEQTSHSDLLTFGVEDHGPARSYEEVANRLSRQFPTPVRPAASSPPTPVPESAFSVAESHTSAVDDETSAPSFEKDHITPDAGPHQHSRPQAPKISLPNEEFPVRHPSSEKEIEIKHPLPRRFGSHPVLQQRPSSIASTLCDTRSTPDSPGPPPPRSPLRLRRDPRTIESIMTNSSNERKTTTPKIAPSIKSTSDFEFDRTTIRATVTTECTGPIKRPKSRNKASSPGRRLYPTNRTDRGDGMRARKHGNRPVANRTIDSVVHAPGQATRQKLKKMRPQLQIPNLRPPPLRLPPEASYGNASTVVSWKNVNQPALTPISPVPSVANDDDDQTGYTPISPTASAETNVTPGGLCMEPVTLVAEKVPVSKAKTTPKPARLILREGKTYAPRPRSASIPRSAMKRRSRTGTQNSKDCSPGSSSPYRQGSRDEQAPPLPSPPPTRALPPTPPVSGSEKTRKASCRSKMVDGRKNCLPTVPSPGVSPSRSSLSENRKLPHVSTQQRKNASHPARSSIRLASRIDARLEALERQNALLSAALVAVLKTNGTLNGPVPGSKDYESQNGSMAWESRVARRSAATSHATSSSNGSALEMYMNTRHGGRHGR